MFRKEIQIRICVRFMEGDYGSNVHAGLEKVSALERFCYKRFLRNSSGTKFFVSLRQVSALEDIRFREVPLYLIPQKRPLVV